MRARQALALLEDLRGLPGVTHAALASAIPLGGRARSFYRAEGMGAVDATNRPRAYLHRVSPGYVETIGLRLIDGRAFGATDLGANATNVMVTQAMAERFWPGQSAIGRRIKAGDLTSENPWWTIVGVLQDANLRGIPGQSDEGSRHLPAVQRALARLCGADQGRRRSVSLIKPAADCDAAP
jgi:hypothetical protein